MPAIYLATLPGTHRNARSIRMIVRDYNLCCQAPGKGNKAKRRMGLHVLDPFTTRPFGCIGMDRGQIARMMRTPPVEPAAKKKT